MGWKHLVIEGHCFFDKDNVNDTIPKFCKNGPGHVGLYCLDTQEGTHKKCEFFAYGTARSTVVLTDNLGEEVTFNAFWSDDDRDNSELWLKKENAWINKVKNKIDNEEF